MILTKEQQYAIKVNEAIGHYFSPEGDGGTIPSNEATEFFMGTFMAIYMLHGRLTGEQIDMIDFITVCNRLVFQYLLEHGVEKHD